MRSACRCRKKRLQKNTTPAIDGTVRIHRETKGRKGKIVTVIAGLPLDGPQLKLAAKALKASCGAGGSAKGGSIILQGDHREKAKSALILEGYRVKLTGG